MRRLTIGLEIAVIIFILLCTVACGGGDGALAEGGINMIVVSGQAKIKSGGGNTSVVEGQEAVVTNGDQIMAEKADVKLLLVDGSLLDLKPDTGLQVVTFSAEGTAKLRQLKGRLEVEAASPLLTIEVSTSGSEGFALKTMEFTATPAVRETAFGLWIDGLNAHLTVEAGEVNVTKDDRTETISAGSEVQASPDELIIPPTETHVGPTVVVVATDDLTPTPTATAAATPTPELLFPPPGLVGPGDGSNFKPSDDILLIWDTPTSLSEDGWYEVQLWREGDVPYTVVDRVKEETWKVEPKYYPGHYQWRILIVSGQEGQGDLSPPSQTWSFSWLSPVVPVSTVPTRTPVSGAPVDLNLTICLRGTRTESGFAALSDDQVYGWEIYEVGQCVYGDAAVQIGEEIYDFEKPLPAPWEVEFEFAKELEERTRNEDGCAEKGAGFEPKKAWFWVGTLDDHSAVRKDNPYSLTMKLYEENILRKSIQVFFTVADAPESPGHRKPEPPIR